MPVSDLLIYPFDPNETSAVSLAIGFQNSISEDRVGDEQRTNHRYKPRRTYSLLEAEVKGEKKQLLRSIMLDTFIRNQHNRLIGVPLWQDSTQLVSVAGADITGQNLNRRQFAASDGETERFAIIWDGVQNYEAFKITSIAGNVITASANIVGDFSEAAFVMPLMVCRCLSNIEVQFLTDWHGSVPVVFTENKRHMQHYTASALTFYQIAGRPLFPFRPNWKQQSPNLVSSIPFDTLEGWGRDAYRQVQVLPKQQFSFGAAFWSRADIAAVLQFFTEQRGRLRQFWLLNQKAELSMYENSPADAAAIKVDNVGYSTGPFLGSNTRRVLAIEHGTKFYIRRVTSAIIVGDYEQLTMSSHLPDELIAADARVSFLRCVRFDQDELKLDYAHDAAASGLVRFAEIGEEETGEIEPDVGDGIDGAINDDAMFLPPVVANLMGYAGGLHPFDSQKTHDLQLTAGFAYVTWTLDKDVWDNGTGNINQPDGVQFYDDFYALNSAYRQVINVNNATLGNIGAFLATISARYPNIYAYRPQLEGPNDAAVYKQWFDAHRAALPTARLWGPCQPNDYNPPLFADLAANGVLAQLDAIAMHDYFQCSGNGAHVDPPYGPGTPPDVRPGGSHEYPNLPDRLDLLKGYAAGRPVFIDEYGVFAEQPEDATRAAQIFKEKGVYVFVSTPHAPVGAQDYANGIYDGSGNGSWTQSMTNFISEIHLP